MIRRILLASLLPTTLVAACSDDGGGTVTASGPHHHYAVNKAFIPKNSAEARMFGLDVDGKEGVDNQLGMVLGTLAGQGFDIQTSIDTAVNEGTINLLVNLQTSSYSASGGAGVSVHLGANPMPMPCADANDTVCGKHLMGTGMFSIDPKSPNDAALTGKIVNGTFTGGPGEVQLQISLAGATVDLSLIGAKVQTSGMSDDKIDTAIVAGAVTQDDLNMKVIPAIQASLGPLIERDCAGKNENPPGDPNATPSCMCMDGSTGKQVLSLFDTTPKDCDVTTDEIKNNGLIQSLLAPDVSIDGKMALSVGLKFSTVKATYTIPGEE